LNVPIFGALGVFALDLRAMRCDIARRIQEFKKSS
jgi:hypothetical protein